MCDRLLAQDFETQANLSYCGVASLVVVQMVVYFPSLLT